MARVPKDVSCEYSVVHWASPDVPGHPLTRSTAQVRVVRCKGPGKLRHPYGIDFPENPQEDYGLSSMHGCV